jgi:hypothetical protein
VPCGRKDLEQRARHHRRHDRHQHQHEEAGRLFAKIQRFADRALVDLPTHLALIRQINARASGNAATPR